MRFKALNKDYKSRFYDKNKSNLNPLLSEMSLISGRYKRISIDNFSAYLDKIGVSKAKKKIALSAFSFSNFISEEPMSKRVKIVTEIQYGVDIGTATTESW